MPLHDWTKVNSGLYHHFHQFWSTEICRALNRGALPKSYSALVEQRSGPKEPDIVAVELNEPDEPWPAGGNAAVLERPRTRLTLKSDGDHYADKANRVVIRHRLGRIVAFIELVSPDNKETVPSLRQFVEKIAQAMRQEIHVLVVDPFPPRRAIPPAFTRRSGTRSKSKNSNCRPRRTGCWRPTRSKHAGPMPPISRRWAWAMCFRKCPCSSPRAHTSSCPSNLHTWLLGKIRPKLSGGLFFQSRLRRGRPSRPDHRISRSNFTTPLA